MLPNSSPPRAPLAAQGSAVIIHGAAAPHKLSASGLFPHAAERKKEPEPERNSGSERSLDEIRSSLNRDCELGHLLWERDKVTLRLGSRSRLRALRPGWWATRPCSPSFIFLGENGPPSSAICNTSRFLPPCRAPDLVRGGHQSARRYKNGVSRPL